MEFANMTITDQELIDAATTVIQKNYEYGKHHVGAAVRARSGKIYAGVHLESKNVDVCAEHVAIGVAFSAGETGFNTVVSIQMRDVPRPTIIPPCQTCQELINFYEPEASVIIDVEGYPKKCQIKELVHST